VREAAGNPSHINIHNSIKIENVNGTTSPLKAKADLRPTRQLGRHQKRNKHEMKRNEVSDDDNNAA
jgi:hypothetical protein